MVRPVERTRRRPELIFAVSGLKNFSAEIHTRGVEKKGEELTVALSTNKA